MHIIKKAKILFFIPFLGGGGAEMHLLRLINQFNQENKFDIILALVKEGGSYEALLNNNIPVHCLTVGCKIRSRTLRVIRAIYPLRKLIQNEKPNLIFSIMDDANLATLIATRYLSIRPKIVIGVQNVISVDYRRSKRLISHFLLRLITYLYPEVDQIVALSKGVADDLVALNFNTSERITVIHNSSADNTILKAAILSSDVNLFGNRPLIVACGRLTEQKGFTYLIKALSHVRKVTQAYLWIVGEGEQRRELEKIIQKLSLVDYVKLLGFQSNPFKYMAAGDVFVSSSLWEGFGNVIVEAMACGAPVVATDCPFGPAEIITNGMNGLLVPPADEKSLGDAIIRVLTEPSLKKQLSEKGIARVKDFEPAKIAQQYKSLFLSILNGT